MGPIRFTSKAVLTVDIVEFSERSQVEQVKATQALFELLRKAVPEDANCDSRRIWSPAGDGGCITFLDDNLLALITAVDLAKLINRYNKYIRGEIEIQDVDIRIKDVDVLPKTEEKLALRTGIYFGPVVKKADFDNRQNIWGYGINMSARVASLAKPKQIVVSDEYYREADLANQTEGYDIRFIGTWWAKHNKSLKLHNVYCRDGDDDVGIPVTQVEEWYTTFHQPLEKVISTYVKMLEDEKKAYRALILAKRILDLCPDKEQEEHKKAEEIIERISDAGKPGAQPGEDKLYDPFFSKLSLEALLYFCQHTQFMAFKSNSDIFKQGEAAHSMMLVVSGEIELYLDDLNGYPRKVEKAPLKEGDIIGEMGLFNPAGRKRTATLKTIKHAITLSLDYNALQLKEVMVSVEAKKEIEKYFPRFLKIQENSIINELLEQIWRLYCKHTIENQIKFIHPLFWGLNEKQREYLATKGKILPEHYNAEIVLTPEKVWEYWTLVVEGSVTAYTTQGNRVIFRKEDRNGNCLGIVRLAVDKNPYATVEVSPNTHLVCLPWAEIYKFLEETSKSYSEEFHRACSFQAIKIRERFRTSQKKGKKVL